MSRFDFDNRGQRQVRDLVLGPGLYGPHSCEGRYVYIDKGSLATHLQKRYAVDTVVQGVSGHAVFVEEKIVRWRGRHYDALTLETKSCTVPGRESDGWMIYGKADLLNYVMCQTDGSVIVRLIDFPLLKAKFWRDVELFRETVSKQGNATACRLTPLAWIDANVGIRFKRRIFPDQDGIEAVKAFNDSHYLATTLGDNP